MTVTYTIGDTRDVIATIPDAQRTPSPPRACTWPGCEFVSSPSGTGSHMAAHRRRTDGAA